MKKKIAVFTLCAMLFALCGFAEAQPTKIPRIGFQFDSPLSAVAARVEGFRQGLRELGYVEGKNIIIEWRSAEGKPERRNEIAADWARLKVDIIVTGGPTTTFAAKEATTTIPIVMAFDNDPVGNGFVASLARPGGNITGLSTLAPEITLICSLLGMGAIVETRSENALATVLNSILRDITLKRRSVQSQADFGLFHSPNPSS